MFAAYQGMFAVITPALMTGAFAERIKFGPFLVFVVLWVHLVYFRGAVPRPRCCRDLGPMDTSRAQVPLGLGPERLARDVGRL